MRRARLALARMCESALSLPGGCHRAMLGTRSAAPGHARPLRKSRWFSQTTAFVPDLQRLPAGAQSAAEKAAAKEAAKGQAPAAKAAKPRKAPGKRRKAGMPSSRPPLAIRSGLHVLLGALHLTWQCR